MNIFTIWILYKNLIYNVMRHTKDFVYSRNLVYRGGVALTCLTNRNLDDYFEKIWVMPNPDNSSGGFSAATCTHGGPIKFNHTYIGHDISRPHYTNAILDCLLSNRITRFASSRAKFLSESFGNRSLLADPRGSDIKLFQSLYTVKVHL